jgi:hypothetical protein
MKLAIAIIFAMTVFQSVAQSVPGLPPPPPAAHTPKTSERWAREYFPNTFRRHSDNLRSPATQVHHNPFDESIGTNDQDARKFIDHKRARERANEFAESDFADDKNSEEHDYDAWAKEAEERIRWAKEAGERSEPHWMRQKRSQMPKKWRRAMPPAPRMVPDAYDTRGEGGEDDGMFDSEAAAGEAYGAANRGMTEEDGDFDEYDHAENAGDIREDASLRKAGSHEFYLGRDSSQVHDRRMRAKAEISSSDLHNVKDTNEASTRTFEAPISGGSPPEMEAAATEDTAAASDNSDELQDAQEQLDELERQTLEAELKVKQEEAERAAYALAKKKEDLEAELAAQALQDATATTPTTTAPWALQNPYNAGIFTAAPTTTWVAPTTMWVAPVPPTTVAAPATTTTNPYAVDDWQNLEADRAAAEELQRKKLEAELVVKQEEAKALAAKAAELQKALAAKRAELGVSQAPETTTTTEDPSAGGSTPRPRDPTSGESGGAEAVHAGPNAATPSTDAAFPHNPNNENQASAMPGHEKNVKGWQPTEAPETTTTDAPETTTTDAPAPPCECVGKRHLNPEKGDWCWLGDEHSKADCTLTSRGKEVNWSWARCQYNGEDQVDCPAVSPEDIEIPSFDSASSYERTQARNHRQYLLGSNKRLHQQIAEKEVVMKQIIKQEEDLQVKRAELGAAILPLKHEEDALLAKLKVHTDQEDEMTRLVTEEKNMAFTVKDIHDKKLEELKATLTREEEVVAKLETKLEESKTKGAELDEKLAAEMGSAGSDQSTEVQLDVLRVALGVNQQKIAERKANLRGMQ